MDTSRNRAIPGLFFGVACLLNLAGCLWAPRLAAAVKPTLMPLLALYTLAAAEGKDVHLLLAALLMGCVGDILLIQKGFFFFAGGMAAFLLGHLCYLTLFGSRAWRGLTPKSWAIALTVMAILVTGLVFLLHIQGVMLIPMILYGLVLMLLIFSGFMGVASLSEPGWGLILTGAILFLASDGMIAAQTFGVIPTIPLTHFLVMLTYIGAQTLLVTGGRQIR